MKDKIDEIYELDCEAFPEEFTTKEWYLERYDGRETVYCYEKDDKLIGYIVVFQIKPEFYNALVSGVLDGDVIVSNKMFKGDGQFNYIGSCVVRKDHRGQGVCRAILNEILLDYEGKTLIALSNDKTFNIFMENNFINVVDCGHYNTVIKGY